MRSKIWLSGKDGRNYVTSIPNEWGDYIKEHYGLEIEKVVRPNKIIITPPYDPSNRRSLENQTDLENIASLKMLITSAYLSGYDEVNIPFPDGPSKEKMEVLQSFIPDSTAQLSYDGKKYRITFPDTMYNLKISEIFGQVKGTFNELSKIVNDSLESFPDKTTLENCVDCAHLHERNLDAVAFSINRYLNKALSYGEIYEKIGLNDNEIVQMVLTFNSLERLADIHYEITEKALHMSKNPAAKQTKLQVFADYYKDAYGILATSLEANDDPEKGLPIVKAKLTKPEWRYYKEGMLLDDEEKIKEKIKQMKDSMAIRDYTILEGKIGAIPGISSNICEFAWNRKMKVPNWASDATQTSETILS